MSGRRRRSRGMGPGLAVAAVALAAGVAMGLAYGLADGLLFAAYFVLTGSPVLVLCRLLVRRRREMGSLSRQFVAGVGIAFGLPLAGVAVVALAMFVSPHDAFTVALLLAFAGALAIYSASLLAGEVMADIQSVRDGVVAVGDGSRDVGLRTRAGDELSELAGAVNRMTQQLAEGEARWADASQAHRNLIAAVSHDLRTPLASLRVLAEAVEDEVVDADTRRAYLEQMSIHIRSLSSLIEDLFELSRLQAGDIQWSLERVRLDELVEETVEAMQVQAQAGGVAVRAEVPPDIAPARANPEKLQRVLFNLIQNGLRHTPADGSVTVRAESDTSAVEVEVADTGVGIEPDERARAFEPFFRGGREVARSGSGAGLGLTICRAIVEAHGGTIWLADSADGLRVRFSLPRAG